MCEGRRYAHLWDSKDKQRIVDNKVFWVLFQSSVTTDINSRPHLYPTIYEKYKHIAAFQITMHQVRIRSLTSHTWTDFPYMVLDEEIDLLISLWPPRLEKRSPRHSSISYNRTQR